MSKKMIELPQQLDDLIEEISNIEYDGIHHQWTKADDWLRQIINNEDVAKIIEEQRKIIGLNDKWKLAYFIFALWMKDEAWINVLVFSEKQAQVWDNDFKEIFKKKLLRSKEDIQVIRTLANNPYMMEGLGVTKERIESMVEEVEQEAEADLDLASLYEKPYKQKRSDMYIRQCEDNLWVEMTMQLEPSISETKQLDFMMKLMGEFKYDGMHNAGKEFKYDTSTHRVRLKKRRQRALKVYCSSQ